MMNRYFAAAAVSIALLSSPARADYTIKDGGGTQRTVKAGTLAGGILSWAQLVDPSGVAFGSLTNPIAVMFGTGALLPSFATPQHFICDSGCGGGGGGGLSVAFGGSIGTLGTPGGFKDGSGNFQSLLGDVTNGQWVNVKASVALPVTGTFFQATQPVSIAAPVAVTGTFWQATQPVSIAGTVPISGTVTANAGTNLNTSALALETGGNLAAINTKMPSLGQALAAGSVPVVLPAAQLSALFQAGGSIGNTAFGISGTLPAFASTPTVNLGTIAGVATQTTLAAIQTALGSPFQAGGSIGNTSFGATQATAANLNATVVGTGTFATQVTSLPATPTGSNIIGRVGIDQTTPGTTNLVSIGTNGTVNPTTAANWGIGTTTQNSASVANGQMALAQFNTTPTTITSGNMSPLQVDNAGNLLVNIKAGASSGAVAQGSTTSGQTGGLTQCAATTSAPTYTNATTNPINCDLAGNVRVLVSGAVGLAQGSTTSGQTGSMVMGAVSTSPPSLTNGQTQPLSLATDGTLRTDDTASSATGSAVPAQASYSGAISAGNLVGIIQASASATVDISTATTTQIVALSGSTKIYVTSFDFISAGTTTFKFVYGTGTNCGTGTTNLTAAYDLAAQAGVAKGSGLGPVLVVPAGNALCMTNSAAIHVAGSLAYTQF